MSSPFSQAMALGCKPSRQPNRGAGGGDGREQVPVLVGEDAALLMGFSSVLSLPYALDHLVPMLATAVDGDPSTT